MTRGRDGGRRLEGAGSVLCASRRMLSFDRAEPYFECLSQVIPAPSLACFYSATLAWNPTAVDNPASAMVAGGERLPSSGRDIGPGAEPLPFATGRTIAFAPEDPARLARCRALARTHARPCPSSAQTHCWRRRQGAAPLHNPGRTGFDCDQAVEGQALAAQDYLASSRDSERGARQRFRGWHSCPGACRGSREHRLQAPGLQRPRWRPTQRRLDCMPLVSPAIAPYHAQ